MRPSPLAPVAVFLSVLVVVAITVVAGPVRLGDPVLPFDDLLRQLDDDPVDAETPAEELVPPQDDVTEGLRRLSVGILVIGAVGAAAALAGLVRLVGMLLSGRARPAAWHLETADGELALDLPDDLRDRAEQAARMLDDAPPGQAGNAVVACWIELERIAGDAGTPRTRAQTPTEFTVALLRERSAAPDAVDELLALYHRARFSSAPVPDAAAPAAAIALRRIAGSLDPAATS